jgi:hypothetical protein
LIVFYNPNAKVEANDPPIPALHVKQLKDHLRSLGKGAAKSKDGQGGGGDPGSKRRGTLSPDQIARIDQAIGLK